MDFGDQKIKKTPEQKIGYHIECAKKHIATSISLLLVMGKTDSLSLGQKIMESIETLSKMTNNQTGE